MEQRFLDFVRGYVRIVITGNTYDRFLNLCAFHGIRLWDLTVCGESYEASILRRDFKKLKAIVKKSHAAVRIKRRYGLPFFIHKYRKRRVYAAGIGAAVLFLLWLSSHIWSIQIEGNLSQTDDVIFEYLEQNGISHGMRKTRVDCRDLAADIRNYFTQFAWVAAELKGTQLIIHVKEGILADPEEANTGSAEEPSDLTASKGGIVESIYVRSGMPEVVVGDEVETGDLLVSGALPIYNDTQEIVSYQYVAADADIIIRRAVPYRDMVQKTVEVKQYTGEKRQKWLLRIGEIPFALPGGFSRLQTYDTVAETVQLEPLPNFYLPVYLEKITARAYEKQKIERTEEEMERLLAENLQYFLEDMTEKGTQIFEKNIRIERQETSAAAVGTLTVGEPAVKRMRRSPEAKPNIGLAEN